MVRGLLIVDGSRNTIVIDAECVHLLIGMGKLKPGDIRRNANMKELNESIRNYLKGVYDNDGTDLQR